MKIVEIRKIYSVLLDREYESVLGRIPESTTIVEVFDQATDRTHYSRWHGPTHVMDLLPGGTLYLSDDFDEAIKIINKKG